MTVKAASGGSAANLASVVWLDAGRDHTCAVLESGQVRCWGKGADGRLGNNAASNSTHAVAVGVASGSNTVAMDSISKKSTHVCAAVSSRDRRRCWDSSSIVEENLNNQLILSPSLVGNLSGNITDSNYCVFPRSGWPKCWGVGAFGQLSSRSTDSQTRTSPALVRMSSGNFQGADIGGGGHWFCGYSARGDISCQGFFTIVTENTITLRTSGVNRPLTQLSHGREALCGVDERGQVHCMGRCSIAGSRTGSNTHACAETSLARTKTQASGNPYLEGALSVVVGQGSTCAVMKDKRAMCWGEQDDGQLGNGSTSDAFKLAGYVLDRSGSTDPLEG